MSTAQSQFLRIFDEVSTYHRWQSYFVGQEVTWDGEQWSYQPFTADGITAGDVASESSLVIGVPNTAATNAAMLESLKNGYLVELEQYEFEVAPGLTAPPSTQRLIASYIGEVIGARGSFTWLEIELGSALSPVGVQIPPRTFTSQLVGVPCQL